MNAKKALELAVKAKRLQDERRLHALLDKIELRANAGLFYTFETFVSDAERDILKGLGYVVTNVLDYTEVSWRNND